MSLSEELRREIEQGKQGKKGVIPLGYDRLNEFVEIARHTMYTIAGETGAGKSSLIQDGFIIKPIQWYLANKDKENIKLSIIYFGMERKMYIYSCKWISRLIFQEQGIFIPVSKILGRKKKGAEIDRMTEHEEKMVDNYLDRLDEWEKDDLLIAHEGSKNPSGISRWLEMFAEKHGTIHRKEIKGSFKDMNMEEVLATKTYTPNHPNHIVLVITDHIAILSSEREGGVGQKKQRLDKFSETMREMRDVYGFSPVIVQQLNRNLSDVQRHKLGELKPKLSDMADSSSTSHDSDVIMALFDPYRHLNDEGARDEGYELRRLKNDKKATFYRTIHVLKNSFNSSGLSIPVAFHPFTGILRSLPRKDNIPEDIYEQVLSGSYFLD